MTSAFAPRLWRRRDVCDIKDEPYDAEPLEAASFGWLSI